MDKRISILKENHQLLGNKISMLQETNKKKDEEADKIRELIAECRENLNRIKCEALNSSQKQQNTGKTPCGGRPDAQLEPDCSQKRSNYTSGEGRQDAPCGKPESTGQPQSSETPCGGRPDAQLEPDCSQKRSNYTSGEGRQDAPCGKPESTGQPQSSETPCGGRPDDPCAKFRTAILSQQSGNQNGPCGSKPDDPCAKYRNIKPCETPKSEESNGGPCGKVHSSNSPGKDPCEDSGNSPKSLGESRTSTLRTQISALADAQAKSRRCIEKLGEKMDKEMKMRIVQGNTEGCPQFDPCECETDGYQERVSCKVDLSKMKINIRGPPEDLKKLDAVQLINLLDKFQCQELVINTGGNDSQLDLQGDVPVFYITHPGNLALIVGIAMVAFLINANLCSLRRGCRMKLLLNMLYLGSFAFHYGIVLWMSFIRGLTLSVGLPRELFNTVDNLILPKYFSICMFLSAITLYSFLATHCTAPCTSWPLPVIVQIIIESITFLIELIAICYIVPAILKLREVTDEFSREEDCPLRESYCRNMEKLAKLNRTITIINTLSVMFMGSNMYYISSQLNIG